jgi:prepilin signal peptidase PulO-like enzyme (type II secretory pathway)
MVIFALIIVGLSLGSFVNAFVWRLHEGKNWINDRSICINCQHELKAQDLAPILSWLWLRGKCRYCHKNISIQYPLIEATVTLLFLSSYELWPDSLRGFEIIIFSLWLLITTGLVALALYDLRYMLLPTKLIYSLLVVAIVMSTIIIYRSSAPLTTSIDLMIGSLIGGGIFYVIYLLSSGKWIGGGDVRLGFLLGLLAATPERSLLLIFLASLIGATLSLILMTFKRLKRTSLIPFGPFLITALFIVQFFGQHLIHWYRGLFI